MINRKSHIQTSTPCDKGTYNGPTLPPSGQLVNYFVPDAPKRVQPGLCDPYLGVGSHGLSLISNLDVVSKTLGMTIMGGPSAPLPTWISPLSSWRP